MRSAVGRATAALAQSGQKLGAVRYANLDVKQLVGVTRLEGLTISTESVMAEASTSSVGRAQGPTFPTVTPGKIAVNATVQCAFQIM